MSGFQVGLPASQLGDPLGMGESVGISREFAEARNAELRNVCRWCDEFFRDYFDMETMQSKFQTVEPL